MNSRVGKALRALVAASAAAIGLVGAAQAAFVVVNADPPYGAAYPNLGWRAAGALYVPDACVSFIGASNTTLNLLAVPNPVCAGIRLQDVTVSLYDIANPVLTLETLNVGTYLADSGAASFADEVSQELIDISFAGGQVVGFSSSLSLPALANALLAGGGNNRFSLEFSSFGARLVDLGAAGTTYADRLSESAFAPEITIGRFIDDEVYLRQLPEPGSFVLALAALAAALMAGLAAGAPQAAPASAARTASSIDQARPSALAAA